MSFLSASAARKQVDMNTSFAFDDWPLLAGGPPSYTSLAALNHTAHDYPEPASFEAFEMAGTEAIKKEELELPHALSEKLTPVKEELIGVEEHQEPLDGLKALNDEIEKTSRFAKSRRRVTWKCPSDFDSNFSRDDYASHDDTIPEQLIHFDSWLPEPPTQPPKQRSFDLDTQNGNAVLTYNNGDGTIGRLEHLHLDIIEKSSPLIAAAFEISNRQPRLHLDALSPRSARPFARYLYIGSYAEVDEHYEDVPSSLLLHCELHQLGALFDMEDLRSQALVNVIRQTEFACFSPDQPIDLCAALRFCYDNIAYCRQPADNIIAYCIERFAAHKLAQDAAFKKLVYEHKPFHTDLAKTLLSRGFLDHSAIDIIRLPSASASMGKFASIDEDLSPLAIRANGKLKMAAAAVPTQPVSSLSARLPVRNKHSLQTDMFTSAVDREEEAGFEVVELSHRPHKKVRWEEDGFQIIDREDNTSCDERVSPNEDDFVQVELPQSTTSRLPQASKQKPCVVVQEREDCNTAEASSPRSESSWVFP